MSVNVFLVGLAATAVAGVVALAYQAGRVAGRDAERAAQLTERLEELGQRNRARHQAIMDTTTAVLRNSDLPARGAGLGPAGVDTDAHQILADVTRSMDALAAHGSLPPVRDVPAPPPISAQIDDAFNVGGQDDDPPRDETWVAGHGDDTEPPSSAPVTPYRYSWPAFKAAGRPLIGVLPRDWMTTVWRATHRPRVRIRRIGRHLGQQLGWAPGEVSTLFGDDTGLSATAPSERLVREGAGVHRRRRIKRARRQRWMAGGTVLCTGRPS